MQDENLPQRTIRTAFALVSFFVLVSITRGQMPIAFGLALGGALGLFSLWSLSFGIPRLVHSSNPYSQAMLGALTLAKLPIYAGTLYFAMKSPLISPLATFVGVALIPTVIVLKTLTYQMLTTDSVLGDEKCRTNPLASK